MLTGENYEIKFGITLKNWGPAMSYSGDGLSTVLNFTDVKCLWNNVLKALKFPSSLNIGASYDFLLFF